MPSVGIGDRLPATQAALVAPTGLTFDSAGTLFIADGDGDRVRKVPGVGMNALQGLTASLTNAITANVPAPLQAGLLASLQRATNAIATLSSNPAAAGVAVNYLKQFTAQVQLEATLRLLPQAQATALITVANQMIKALGY